MMVSNAVYIAFSIVTTCIGDIKEQMLVNPTTSLNRTVQASKTYKQRDVIVLEELREWPTEVLVPTSHVLRAGSPDLSLSATVLGIIWYNSVSVFFISSSNLLTLSASFLFFCCSYSIETCTWKMGVVPRSMINDIHLPGPASFWAQLIVAYPLVGALYLNHEYSSHLNINPFWTYDPSLPCCRILQLLYMKLTVDMRRQLPVKAVHLHRSTKEEQSIPLLHIHHLPSKS